VIPMPFNPGWFSEGKMLSDPLGAREKLLSANKKLLIFSRFLEGLKREKKEVTKGASPH